MAEEDTKKDIKFDVAVIGAGPAGIMSAITASEAGLKVALIEKNFKLGKKFLLTGNGRSNLTNAEFNLRELAKNYNNGEFLFHVFSIFGTEQTIRFFEKLGVETKIEKGKRVFPVSDDAKKVLEALEKELKRNEVEIIYNAEVLSINKTGNKITKLILTKGEITAKNYIFCTGGKSYCATGSNGLGFSLVEKLGHTIIKPKPALTPIKLKGDWVKELQGISLKDVNVSVLNNAKKQFSENGEIIFTQYGISGPVVFDISGKVGELLDSGEVKISFDLFPLLNNENLLKEFDAVINKYPNKNIKNILCSFVPERLAEILLRIEGINGEKTANNISKIDKSEIVKTLKNIEVIVEDILGFENAMVTRGGVDLKEINHKTMKSKIIDNLYFAGEIINVDGKTGGFNLQECWSTGYIAGKSVIKEVK